MKRNGQFARGCRFAVLLLAATVFVVVMSHSSSIRRRDAPVNGNPQQFHLWGMSNDISFTFNCDPRASDEWLYRSAAGNLGDGNPAMTNISARGGNRNETWGFAR